MSAARSLQFRLDGGELSLESAAVRELADGLGGNLFLQADEGYADAAKLVWNGMFDSKATRDGCAVWHPLKIVVSAVNFAREREACYCPLSAVATACPASRHLMAA